jgi:hypothetical protein
MFQKAGCWDASLRSNDHKLRTQYLSRQTVEEEIRVTEFMSDVTARIQDPLPIPFLELSI